MVKLKLEEFERFPVLPRDAVIGVRVDDITVQELEGKWGPWQKLDFKFAITHVPEGIDPEEHVGAPIWGSVKMKFVDDPNNELLQWVKALLGFEELPVGFELDTDLLLGREAKAIVDNYDRNQMDPDTGKPIQGHKVGALIPKGGTQPAPQPVAAGVSSSAYQQDTLTSQPTDDVPF